MQKEGTHLCIVIICRGYVVKGNYLWVSTFVNIISMGMRFYNQNFLMQSMSFISLVS